MSLKELTVNVAADTAAVKQKVIRTSSEIRAMVIFMRYLFFLSVAGALAGI
jgi:hypothetical protein